MKPSSYMCPWTKSYSDIARDREGNWYQPCSKIVNTKVKSPSKPKPKLFMCAVELASQMQLKNLVIEGDSKNCIEAMTNKSKLVHWRIANFSMRSDCYMQDLSCWSLIGCTRMLTKLHMSQQCGLFQILLQVILL